MSVCHVQPWRVERDWLALRPAARRGLRTHALALGPHATPTSRIVAIAVRLLRRQSPGLRLIVSYADPEQRGPSGDPHLGILYQALSFQFIGCTNRESLIRLNGRLFHPRTVTSATGRDRSTGCSVTSPPMPGTCARRRNFATRWRSMTRCGVCSRFAFHYSGNTLTAHYARSGEWTSQGERF